jgi:hypothetical protein
MQTRKYWLFIAAMVLLLAWHPTIRSNSQPAAPPATSSDSRAGPASPISATTPAHSFAHSYLPDGTLTSESKPFIHLCLP